MIYLAAYLAIAPVVGLWLLGQDPYRGSLARSRLMHAAWFLLGPQVWAMTVILNQVHEEDR